MAAAEWIEDSTGGKKVFNWDRKKKWGNGPLFHEEPLQVFSDETNVCV